MHPLVSVIVPTYNRADMVCRAVNSILGQSYKNIEVIVVDDNQKDSRARFDTEKAISVFNADSRVKYIQNPSSLGGSGARNVGIENALGEYISFLDDDDIYLKNKLEIQVSYMLQNDCDMSFSNVRIHNSDDRLIDFRDHRQYIDSFENSLLLKQHLMHSLTPTATYMYKAEALKSIGGFHNKPVGQEFDLMLRTIQSGMKIGFFPECGVIQYHHSGERISLGNNKLNGEMIMYDLKKSFFDVLSPKQQSFIKFRHYVVLAVAGLRSKKFGIFIKNGFLAFFASPTMLITEYTSHRARIKAHEKDELIFTE